MTGICLLTSNAADPIIPVLGAMEQVSHVTLDALGDHVALGDWPQIIDTRFPPELEAAFAGATVVNRLFAVREATLMQRLRDRRFHEIWAHVAVGALLGRSTHRVHDTGVRGVSRSLLPLPTQWDAVRQALPAIGIPRYVYAFGGERPDLSDMVDPIQKSVWSIFDWVVETALPDHERAWHRFYVERPTGTPVIAFFVDPATQGAKGLGLICPRGEPPLDPGEVLAVAREAQRLFRSDIGEMLLYADDAGALTFQGFSPLMESGLADPRGQRMLRDWLVDVAR